MTRYHNPVVRLLVHSIVRILGPNVFQAIPRLTDIANTSPTITDLDDAYTTASTAYVCIPTMHVDYSELNRKRFTDYGEDLAQYLDSVDVGRPITKTQLIKTTKYRTGDSSFTFEWSKRPTTADYLALISRIDDALTPIGCRYTIMTKW